MKIETTLNPGGDCYFMQDNKVVCRTVDSIKVFVNWGSDGCCGDLDIRIVYTVPANGFDGAEGWCDLDSRLVFPTKEALLASL